MMERLRGNAAFIFLLACFFALAWFVEGCAFHVGRTGIDGVLAGTFYSHSDDQMTTGKDCTDDCQPGVSRWHTHAARTWGTSGIEGKITANDETISIQGEGISDKLAGVLGEDVIAKAVEAYIRSTPSGAVLSGARALFGGDETPAPVSVPVPLQPLRPTP